MDEESLLALPSVSQNIDRMAREISAKIARIYKYSLRKGGGRLSLNDSVKIVELFNYAASCSSEVVEAVKHRVSEEESDFKDMGDLIADLQPDQSQYILRLFLSIAPPISSLPFSQYSCVVLSDLDNTVIENLNVCTIHYVANDVVPGYVPITRALTCNWSTTLTFISARPKNFEIVSILSIKRVLADNGIHSFSFESGEISGTVLYAQSVAARLAGRVELANKLLLQAALLYAELKYQSYKKLVQIYPHAKFVFFGDDTQGDYIFGCRFVNDRPNNFAFIRRIADYPVSPDGVCWPSPATAAAGAGTTTPTPEAYPLSLIYHTSYYEAIIRAPEQAFSASGGRREDAATYAAEEYNTKYLPLAAAGRFANLAEATARDSPWIPQILGLAAKIPSVSLTD